MPTFSITDTKFYVPVVTLLTQDNVKFLKQLESGFKRTINWNNYLSKTTNQAQNQYLNFLIVPSFHGVNRLFVLSFENEDDWESYNKYYLPTIEKYILKCYDRWKKYFWSTSKIWFTNIW